MLNTNLPLLNLRIHPQCCPPIKPGNGLGLTCNSNPFHQLISEKENKETIGFKTIF